MSCLDVPRPFLHNGLRVSYLDDKQSPCAYHILPYLMNVLNGALGRSVGGDYRTYGVDNPVVRASCDCLDHTIPFVSDCLPEIVLQRLLQIKLALERLQILLHSRLGTIEELLLHCS